MENLTYDQATKELTQIVSTLENGQITLDEALKLFERGKELISFCYSSINLAKGKLTEIKETLGKLEEI